MAALRSSGPALGCGSSSSFMLASRNVRDDGAVLSLTIIIVELMPSFVYASDLHGNRDSYDRLFDLEADAVVLGGDLLPHTKGPLERRIDAQKEFARDYLAAKFASRPCY